MADLPPLREVIRDHGLGARKSLGQHFLLDTNLIDRIARAGGDMTGRTAIEVGPGPGGLTRALLESNAKEVIVVEKDSRCIAALEELAAAYPGRLAIIEGDATEIDVADLGSAPRRLVANLPYNVSTILTLQWLTKIDAFESMTLMYQKEVADRLTAQPGTKAFGRLSVITQWLCEARTLFNVSKEAFTPPPKVVSAVVGFIPRPAPLAPARMSDLEKITQAVFGQRRKMIKAPLKRLGLEAEKAGIDGSRRAEQLEIEEFCALARLLEAQLLEAPLLEDGGPGTTS